MEKQEFLDLFDTAIQAAKSARTDDKKNSREVLRCTDAMNSLKKAPESLACDVLCTTTIGESFRFFIHHQNPKIQSESRLLWDLWLTFLYATGKRQMEKTGDSKRDKVREILQTSLAKVANEVVEIEMKKRVVSCDPSIVAVSVESVMFGKLGCFLGPQKGKYRSILFNMGDSNNPDLRRRVLLGEINGDKLVTMEKEEMGSDKIQMEVQHLKEKARLKEESRLKMMHQSDMIMTW